MRWRLVKGDKGEKMENVYDIVNNKNLKIKIEIIKIKKSSQRKPCII